MNNRVQVGDVIQVGEHLDGCEGCLFIVDSVRSWGVTARLKVPFQGETFLRLRFDQFDLIGKAALMPAENCES